MKIGCKNFSQTLIEDGSNGAAFKYIEYIS